MINTCVKHNFKIVHVSNLFWSREYNSAKEICKYPSFSKVGGNYSLDLKIIWSSGLYKLMNLGIRFCIVYWLQCPWWFFSHILAVFCSLARSGGFCKMYNFIEQDEVDNHKNWLEVMSEKLIRYFHRVTRLNFIKNKIVLFWLFTIKTNWADTSESNLRQT